MTQSRACAAFAFTLLVPVAIVAQDGGERAKRGVPRFAPLELISSRLFGSVADRRGVFQPTEQLHLEYLDPIEARSHPESATALASDPEHPLPGKAVLFSEGRPFFRLRWELASVKRIAVFNVDATRAGYSCCSTDSMEQMGCAKLPTLMKRIDLPPGTPPGQRVFQARHSFVNFDRQATTASDIAVRAITADGRRLERRVRLYFRATSIHLFCSPSAGR